MTRRLAAHATSQRPAAPFDPSARPPFPARDVRIEPGIAVHRGSVVAGLIDLLAERYPVVRRLAGDDSFQAVAHRYVLREPPRSPSLLHYGETFPRFVRGLGTATTLEYLADIAALEWTRGRARHAAEAAPVTRDAFAALAADRRGGIRVLFHPSVGLVKSRFPIVSIWEANRDGDGDGLAVSRWCPEYALVARPFADVEVRRLTAGGFAFLDALAKLSTLSSAAAAALDADASFDLAAHVAMLIESNIVVGFGRSAS